MPIDNEYLDNIKRILDNQQYSIKKSAFIQKRFLETLGYSIKDSFFRDTQNIEYIYNSNNIKLYKCEKIVFPIKNYDFDNIEDIKKYKTIPTCKIKNKLIIDEVKKNTLDIENKTSTFQNIDKNFEKCYVNYDVDKVRNDCDIYKAPNKTYISNKIKNYIIDKTEDLNNKIKKKIKNQYKVNVEVDNYNQKYSIKYKVDYDSIK